jgi:ABC-type antimicrobial peptide transport system permease subunit
MFIALGGASIGLGLSTGLLALMTAAITGGTPSMAAMPMGVLAGGLAIALTFAVLTGLLPALRASRCRPAEAFSRS